MTPAALRDGPGLSVYQQRLFFPKGQGSFDGGLPPYHMTSLRLFPFAGKVCWLEHRDHDHSPNYQQYSRGWSYVSLSSGAGGQEIETSMEQGSHHDASVGAVVQPGEHDAHCQKL
jgi:hypothetical protein